MAYFNLIVDEWIQTISHKEELYPAGASMRCHCHAVDDYQLTLSTEERISQIPFEVDLSIGPVMLGKGRPIERGIGLLDYYCNKEVRPPSGIASNLGFYLDHYNEIWAQVRNGTFSSSAISLDLAPLPFQTLPRNASGRSRITAAGYASSVPPFASNT